MAQDSGTGLVVQRVSGRKQLKEFIAFPHRLYANDPNWVAPLWFEQLQRFSDKNPYFEHAKWQPWVVRRGARIVGRISAQIDDLYNETHSEETGYFGLIEAEDDRYEQHENGAAAVATAAKITLVENTADYRRFGRGKETDR